MTPHHPRGRAAAALAVALAAMFLFPTLVAAHAHLDVPTPEDGATVEGTPAEISGTFTQDVNPDGSSLQLRNAAGDVIATGSVDAADDRRMVIADLPELEPGEYEVRWTTLSAEDGELDRDTWSFTVAAAPTPSPSPTAAPTAEPTPTEAATATPAPSEPSAAPSPSGSGTDDDPASTTDVLIPIVAGLAVVLVAAGALLNRRGGRSTRP